MFPVAGLMVQDVVVGDVGRGDGGTEDAVDVEPNEVVADLLHATDELGANRGGEDEGRGLHLEVQPRSLLDDLGELLQPLGVAIGQDDAADLLDVLHEVGVEGGVDAGVDVVDVAGREVHLHDQRGLAKALQREGHHPFLFLSNHCHPLLCVIVNAFRSHTNKHQHTHNTHTHHNGFFFFFFLTGLGKGKKKKKKKTTKTTPTHELLNEHTNPGDNPSLTGGTGNSGSGPSVCLSKQHRVEGRAGQGGAGSGRGGCLLCGRRLLSHQGGLSRLGSLANTYAIPDDFGVAAGPQLHGVWAGSRAQARHQLQFLCSVGKPPIDIHPFNPFPPL